MKRKVGKRETLAEFLARGGTIELIVPAGSISDDNLGYCLRCRGWRAADHEHFKKQEQQ